MSDLNDPRVYFAAERTALAWNRTALTLMTFGFAIERFGLFMKMMIEKIPDPDRGAAFWFGLVFILLGCFFSVFAAKQYRAILRSLKPVEIPAMANTQMPLLLNLIIATLAAVLAVYLLVTNVL
jgi:putative membrane protein